MEEYQLKKLQRAFVQAAEENDGSRVFWDKAVEQEFTDKFAFIYNNAKKEFQTKNET